MDPAPSHVSEARHGGALWWEKERQQQVLRFAQDDRLFWVAGWGIPTHCEEQKRDGWGTLGLRKHDRDVWRLRQAATDQAADDLGGEAVEAVADELAGVLAQGLLEGWFVEA